MTEQIDYGTDVNVNESLAPQPEIDSGPKLDSIVIYLLGGVLLIYTGWRSFDLLSKSVPDEWKIIAFVGLFGLDFGLIGWALAYAKGATTGAQKMLARSFIVIDALGVLISGLTDSLMYNSGGDAVYQTLEPIVMFLVPIIIMGNAFATLAYKLADEKVIEDRKKRDREHERRQRIAQQNAMIQKQKDDLEYATTWNLYRQRMIGLQENLAKVKVALDAREQANRQILSSGKHVDKAAQEMGFGPQSPAEEPLRAMPKIEIPDWMKLSDKDKPQPVFVPAAGQEYADQGGALAQGTGNGNGTKTQRTSLQDELFAEYEANIQTAIDAMLKQYPNADRDELEKAVRGQDTQLPPAPSADKGSDANPPEAGETSNPPFAA